MPDFTKKAQVSCMCFISLNYLYTAHHNLLGICHQLKIHHLYRTFNFSTQCICMGTGSLFVYVCCRLRGNARPLWRKIVFAVASILGAQGKKCTSPNSGMDSWFGQNRQKLCVHPCLCLRPRPEEKKLSGDPSYLQHWFFLSFWRQDEEGGQQEGIYQTFLANMAPIHSEITKAQQVGPRIDPVHINALQCFALTGTIWYPRNLNRAPKSAEKREY